MKQHLLNSLILLFALIAGGNLTASAADESVTFSKQGYTNAQEVSSYSGTNFSITFDKGTNSNTPKYYTSGKAIRVYGGGTMTVSSTTKSIAKIELTFGSSDGSNEITANVGTYNAGTWTGKASSVTFTVGGTSGARRIASVAVTYYSAVKSPVISPVDGTTFTGTQSVTITQADSKPVYYTTDGSTPTKSSTLYTGAFDVAASAVTGKVTVKAIAYDGEEASSVVSATYTDTSIQPLNVAFTFNNALFGTSYSGSVNKAIIEAAGGKVTGTVKNVQVEYALGTGSNFYLKDSEIRVYSGNTLTFTAPTGYNITKIVFTGGTLQYNGSALSNRTWEGEENSVVFTATSSTTVTTAAVTLERALPLVATLGALNVTALEKDATGTFSTTVTPATGLSDSDYTLSWAATPAGLNVAANGAYTAVSRGTYTVTATATSNNPSSYKDASKEYTVTVSAPVEVTASNVEMTYGDAAKAIGATASYDYAGTLSYASENPAVATVDASGNVTAVAVGTTTITITSAADVEHLYLAGDPVAIDVTVNAPAGKTTMTAEEYYLYYEKIIGNGTNFPTGWAGDGEVWNVDNTYGAQTGTKNTYGNGTAGETYDLVTCDYDLSGYTGLVLDFDHTGKTFSNPSNACKVFIQEGTNTPVQLNIEYFSGSNFTWKEVRDIDIDAYQDKTVHFIFRYTPTSGNDGKWQVRNFGVYGEYKKITATLNANGYATICSEYPLDFSDYEAADYSAWQVTVVSGNEITFEQITGSVKGGTGILLMGTHDATVTLNSVASSETLSTNKLVGTLAPTYVADNEYYGLSGDKFVKVNAGTVPAGKALLPADAVVGGVKALSFKFDGADGISEIMTNGENEKMSAIYDLSGRRVVKPTKGLYIVNGKKVVK